MDEFYAKLEDQGFASQEFRPLFASINQTLLKKIKLSSNRLAQAMIDTYETMCQQVGVSILPSVRKDLSELAEQVYFRAPEPMEHVDEILALLQKDFQLFFYSAGLEKTQKIRLDKLGLRKYFQDRIFVIAKKDLGTIRKLLKASRLDVKKTWMVGNSPKFDINPALQVGLNCIWMHTSFWKQELIDISINPVFGAFSLQEVGNILLYGNGFGPEKYSPPTRQLEEIRLAVSKFSGSKSHNVWLIGSSPKLDINPGLSLGLNVVWIPTTFDSSDVEAFSDNMFVSFSPEGAERIVAERSRDDLKEAKIIWRLRKDTGDLGGSLIVD